MTNPSKSPETFDPEEVRSPKLDLMAFATLFQEWGELCDRRMDKEYSPALKWYLAGRRDAHNIDAFRVREFAQQTAKGSPPRGNLIFTSAYEALLNMMDAMSDANGEESSSDVSTTSSVSPKDNLTQSPSERLETLKQQSTDFTISKNGKTKPV